MSELRTRDGFTVDLIWLDRYNGQMAVTLGDGTVIYNDTPVAPRDQWLVEADDGATPSDAPRFRVIQTLHAKGNDPVTVPYGEPTTDLFKLVHSAVTALAWVNHEDEVPNNPIMLKVEIIRVVG